MNRSWHFIANNSATWGASGCRVSVNCCGSPEPTQADLKEKEHERNYNTAVYDHHLDH